ncbi:hypothetical protein [Desulfosporosinus fructosivorans]
MKYIFRSLVLMVILSLLTIGCTKTGNIEDIQETGLDISSMMTGIGGVDTDDNNHDIQRFDYSLNLANKDKDTVYIREVTLVLPRVFEETLITKQLTVPVNKDIPSMSAIVIKGSLDFKTNGLSKEDIGKLNPRISSVKVINERTISLDKWSH